MTTTLLNAFWMPMNGLSMIFDAGLKRFVLVPLLINMLIFGLVAWISGLYFAQFLDWALPEESWLGYFRWILWPLAALSYFFLSFYSFTIVANLIGSPFNGLLAARVEQRLTGKLPPESEQGLLQSILPAISGELGKLLHLLLLSIPVLILMLIPGLNLLGSILWILLGFWFLAYEYADYPMGNHHILAREQRQRLKKRPLQTLAFGAGASLLLLIPVINLAAMPATVVGATRLWVESGSLQ